MSSNAKKTRGRKKKESPAQSDDFSPPAAAVVEAEQKSQGRGRGRGKGQNKNDVVRSRIKLIIDMLGFDGDVDERTLKYNVAISVKHLKEVIEML